MALKAVLQDINTEVPDWVLSTASNVFAPVGTILDAWEKDFKGFVTTNVDGGAAYINKYETWLTNNVNVHSARLPLMNPFHVVVICLAYVLGVFFLRQFMRVLPSAKDSGLMKLIKVIHNGFLVALSGYMSFEVARQAIINDYKLWLNPLDNSAAGWGMAKILWVFYVSKIPEFGDTIIMLLCHNFRQVSFLHIYHHATIFPIWWLVVFLAPTGDSYWSAALNSFVHVVMYSYYLYTTLGLPFPLKFWITNFQMAQFFSNLIQAAVDVIVPIQNYPVVLCHILLVYMISLLALFYNFLTKNRAAAAARKRVAGAPVKGGKGGKAKQG